jgi:hypothetical protein
MYSTNVIGRSLGTPLTKAPLRGIIILKGSKEAPFGLINILRGAYKQFIVTIWKTQQSCSMKEQGICCIIKLNPVLVERNLT